MDPNQKFPYTLVKRPLWAGGNPVSLWQVIDVNEAVFADKEIYAVELIDLENSIIVLEDIKTKKKYSLTSNDDSRKFNVYWKSNNEFEKESDNVNPILY